MSRNDDGTLSPVYSAASAGHPLVFELPSTNDGYYYTYLGRTYTSSSVVYLELELDHPTFYYDGGINVYNGKESEYALVIDYKEFTSNERAFTDAEIARLKNSNKPIKLTDITSMANVESVSGFYVLYKNVNDVGIDAIAQSGFDYFIYLTTTHTGGRLTKFALYIDCNSKIGQLFLLGLNTNTLFNNT